MAADNPSDRVAWLKLAKEAMTQALADHPAATQNKTLLASLEEQLGDREEALRIMKSPSPTSKVEQESDVYLANYYKKMHKAQDDALANFLSRIRMVTSVLHKQSILKSHKQIADARSILRNRS